MGSDIYPNFHLGTITVKKENIAEYKRGDGNRLYNFMINSGVVDIIELHETCKLTRDNRTLKLNKGNSCIDYLQTIVWYHQVQNTILTDDPKHSHTDDGLIFIDWITNIVWSKYEDNYPNWRNIIGNLLIEKQLFF